MAGVVSDIFIINDIMSKKNRQATCYHSNMTHVLTGDALQMITEVLIKATLYHFQITSEILVFLVFFSYSESFTH